MRVNHNYIKSKIDTNNKNFKYVSMVLELLSWLSKLIIIIFLTPVIAVSSYFTKDLFAVIINILLSIAHLATLTYAIKTEESDLQDGVLSIIGITALYLLISFITGNVIEPGNSFFKVLYQVNLLATAVNVYSLVSDVVTPPIKTILNKLIKSINMRFSLNISSLKIGDTDPLVKLFKKEVFLRCILTRNYGHKDDELYDLKSRAKSSGQNGSKVLPDKVLADMHKITKLLEFLKSSITKHSSHVIGAFSCKDKISELQKAKDDILTQYDAAKAIKIIQNKRVRNSVKLEKIEKAIKHIKNSSHSKFDKKFLKMFSDVPNVYTKSDMRQVHGEALTLLEQHKKYQEDKISMLRSILP